MQGVAPPEACRMVSLEIDFSGSRGGAISALAVDQVYLGGPETPIRAGKVLQMPKCQCCKAEQDIEISASIFSDSWWQDMFWLILASRAHLNNVISRYRENFREFQLRVLHSF